VATGASHRGGPTGEPCVQRCLRSLIERISNRDYPIGEAVEQRFVRCRTAANCDIVFRRLAAANKLVVFRYVGLVFRGAFASFERGHGNGRRGILAAVHLHAGATAIPLRMGF